MARAARKRILLFLFVLSIVFLIYTNVRLLDPLFESLTKTKSSAVDIDALHRNDLPGERNTRILLISAFFPLANTSYTFDNYRNPLSLFLSRITTDVYFFTPPEYEPAIRKMRGHLPIAINTTYSTPFDIPPLQHRRRDYVRMETQDRERDNNSPEYYAFNTAKHFFLKEGLENVRQLSKPGVAPGYRYAFWVDPGTFRQEHSYQTWPAPGRVDIVWDEGYDETLTTWESLMYFPIVGLPHGSMSLWTDRLGPIRSKFSQTSFFGGRPAAIAWWYKVYFMYHDNWLQRGAFVGRDQAIVNALFLLFPSRFITTWLTDPRASTARAVLRTTPGFRSYTLLKPPPSYVMATPLGQCLDPLAYHVFYFASIYERDKMTHAWLKRRRWAKWPWQWLRQMNTPKVPCTMTKILSIEGVLRYRVFGRTWSSPHSSLDV